MCSNCPGSYEDPDRTNPEIIEIDGFDEKGSTGLRLGVWAAVIGICGTVWGFLIGWIYPLIHAALK